jgi:hypothetical protein
MAALNFPNSPSLNEIYTFNGKSWRWDGYSWKTYFVLDVPSGGTGFTGYSLGDLLVGAGSSFIKFGVGTDNYVLKADSTSGSGLTWAIDSGGIASLNGLTAVTQLFETGTSGAFFNISSVGSSHTFNIPIAGSGATGLVSTGAQTFAGQKTFSSAIIGDLTGTATTAGFAQTANYSYQSGYGITSGLATTATYASQSGYGLTSGFATTSANVDVRPATSAGTQYLIFSNQISASGTALSANSTFKLDPSTNILSVSGLAITSTESSTSSSTGALTIAGGVGIGGSLFVDGSSSSISGVVLSNGTIVSGNWAGNAITSLYGGTGINSYTTGDILVGVGNTLSIIPVGSDNYILSADSTSSTGVTWKAASAAGTTTIGTPTDGVYTDGFFTDWTNNTAISNAFDDVNELLALIAPAKPGSITSTSLTATSVPTYYSVGISAGLGTEWYQAGFGTGSTITRYYLSGAHTLTTANTSTAFYAGTLVTSTYGTLGFGRYNYLSPSGAGYGTIDMTTNYTVGATNNNLRLSDLAVYNNIWTKANAQISAYTQTYAGYEGVYITHSTNSQVTNTYNMWKDPWSAANGSPSYSKAATATTTSQTLKYLSGISYYTTGTGFSVDFKGAAGIYSSCYNVTQVYRITATGLNTINGTVSSPMFSDELDKTGSNAVSATLNSASASSFTKSISTTIYKAHGTTATSSAAIAKYINTYTTVSTDTYEGFQDEARRLVIDTGIGFTSNIDMANGNLQVRSGTLIYPQTAEYDAEYGGSHTFSGNQEYQRYFYKTSASTGTLTFGGFTASNISPYGTGSVNVLLYLEGDAKYFDLGTLQGSNANDGSTRSLAISAKTSASSGALNWSLGVYTTGVSGAGNSARYRAIIIFRNNTYTMTSITSS